MNQYNVDIHELESSLCISQWLSYKPSLKVISVSFSESYFLDSNSVSARVTLTRCMKYDYSMPLKSLQTLRTAWSETHC